MTALADIGLIYKGIRPLQRLGAQARDLAETLQTPLKRMREEAPTRLAVVPPDPWAGDAQRGRDMIAGVFRFGGQGMYGPRVHEAVLAAGVAESGCTVHEVDEEYDHGATLIERRCAVLPGDSKESLAERVYREELAAYPQAIAMMLERLARSPLAAGSVR